MWNKSIKPLQPAKEDKSLIKSVAPVFIDRYDKYGRLVKAIAVSRGEHKVFDTPQQLPSGETSFGKTSSGMHVTAGNAAKHKPYKDKEDFHHVMHAVWRRNSNTPWTDARKKERKAASKVNSGAGNNWPVGGAEHITAGHEKMHNEIKDGDHTEMSAVPHRFSPDRHGSAAHAATWEHRRWGKERDSRKSPFPKTMSSELAAHYGKLRDAHIAAKNGDLSHFNDPYVGVHPYAPNKRKLVSERMKARHQDAAHVRNDGSFVHPIVPGVRHAGKGNE